MAKDSSSLPTTTETDSLSESSERATLASIRDEQAQNDDLISKRVKQVKVRKSKLAKSAESAEKLLNIASAVFVGLAINSITAGTFANFALEGGRDYSYLILGLAYGVFFVILASVVSHGSTNLLDAE